jgi:hypothetical protein
MSPFFKKLGLKDRKQILVVKSPESFEGELAALEGVEIFRDPRQAKEVGLALAFVTAYGEVDRLAPMIAKKTPGDATVCISYPKGKLKTLQVRDQTRPGLALPWGKKGLSLSPWSRLMRIGPPSGSGGSSSTSR